MEDLDQMVSQPWSIMEICGGQTHSLVKNGILDLLPREITMIHGPGCPVCVTPVEMIDQAITLAENGHTVCSFGDMLRVPGSEKSLLKARSQGAQVEIVYSPIEALQYAEQHPDQEVVFFAVGFETTAPANALSVIMAEKKRIRNYSLLVSHVLVPPAMETILADEDNRINAFLAAGHVCTVMGYNQYHQLAEKYQIPIVVTGFEPVDLLRGIHKAIELLESGKHIVENEYSRVVDENGNQKAIEVINQVFEISDRNWRGMGTIPESGFKLNKRFERFDAEKKLDTAAIPHRMNTDCVAGMILKGKLKPRDCKHFGAVCTPENPLGAPMVSSEGACAAYYHFNRVAI